MPNVTHKSCNYLFILLPEKFTHATPSVYFRRVVSLRNRANCFKVLVFGSAAPDIEPVRCTLLGILVF